MKQLLAMLLLFGFSQTATADFDWLNQISTQQVYSRAIPKLKNLKWEVGEFQERKIRKGGLGVGSVTSVVDREEGNGLWLVSELKIIFQKKMLIEALIDRTTGEIVRYIEDGTEKNPPSATELDDCIDLGEAAVKIKVPAGTFDAIRSIVRCPDDTYAFYVNEKEVNMNGQIRQDVLTEEEDPKETEYTVFLTKFGKM